MQPPMPSELKLWTSTKATLLKMWWILSEVYAQTKRKITLEYILFQKLIPEEDARNLVKIAKEFPCFINLIEYNSVEGILRTGKPQPGHAGF